MQTQQTMWNIYGRLFHGDDWDLVAQFTEKKKALNYINNARQGKAQQYPFEGPFLEESLLGNYQVITLEEDEPPTAPIDPVFEKSAKGKVKESITIVDEITESDTISTNMD